MKAARKEPCCIKAVGLLHTEQLLLTPLPRKPPAGCLRQGIKPSKHMLLVEQPMCFISVFLPAHQLYVFSFSPSDINFPRWTVSFIFQTDT